MARRNFVNTAAPTSLASGISDSVETLSVVSAADYPPVPFTIALRRGTVSEELCLVTGVAGNTFTVTREYGGTTAVAHPTGASVEHVSTAEDYDEANAHITLSNRDDHPQYLNAARHSDLDHRSIIAAAGAAPVGSVVAWAGDPQSLPTGWVLCDGSSLSRSGYAALFDVLGTSYGSVNTTTFRVPDFRGRVPVGSDPNNLRVSSSNATARGGSGGVDRVTLTLGQMPRHTHSSPAHTHTGQTTVGGRHFHGNNDVFGFLGAAVRGTTLHPGRFYVEGRAGGGWDYSWGTTTQESSHRHSFTTNARSVSINHTGGSEPHSNMMPYLTVAYIIRAEP